MDIVVKALRNALIAVLVLLCVQAASGFIVAPYSDEELRGSLVDTWEVHELYTLLVLGFCAFVAMCSAVFAFWGYEQTTRRTARLVLGLSLLAAILAYANHAVLTVRTTRLTGQTFGRFLACSEPAVVEPTC